jgi:hypothetical protein
MQREYRVTSVGCLVLLTVLATTPPLAWAQTKKPAPLAVPKAFRVEIEQGGKPVAVKDHEAFLARAPFSLLVSSPDSNGVYVHASFDSGLYDLARAGTPFGKRVRSTVVGAEGNANSDHEIFMARPGDETLNYWYYGAKDDVRFDEATALGSGYRGRRTVGRLFFDAEHVVDMASVPRKPLYLVFVRGQAQKGGDYAVVEEQRDYLKLYLETVSDSVKEAARSAFTTFADSGKPMAEREAALQTLARMGKDAIASMDALGAETRLRANEATAIGDIRTLISSEAAYAVDNGGFYDTPACLANPTSCQRTRTPPSSYLNGLADGPRHGYQRRFVAGSAPRAEDLKKQKASPSSIVSFAVVAVPTLPGETGERGFCGDASGKICFTADGSAPPVKNGACAPGCTTLP